MTEPIVISGPISIFQTAGMNGRPSRRLFIDVKDLDAIPDELFAVKISQSKNPSLAGKPVFKYFSYKVNENTPFSALAPDNTTLATPVSEIKSTVVSKLGALPGAKYSLNIALNGSFANIETSEGIYTIFDDKEFPATEGKPGYYVASGTEATVTITRAQSQYGPYYRTSIKTALSPDEVFVKAGKGKVWGAETQGSVHTSAAEDATDGAVW